MLKKTVQIGPYRVTVDAADAPRVSANKWTPIEGEFVMFVTDTGTPANPAYRTLGQVLLGTDAFVDLKDRSSVGQLDYRRKNLKAS